MRRSLMELADARLNGSRLARLAGRWVLVVLLGASLVPNRLSLAAAACLAFSGGVVFCIAGTWALFHPRAVLRARSAAWRRAVRVAPLLALISSLPGVTFLIEASGFSFRAMLQMLLYVAVDGALLVALLFAAGCTGAGISLLVGRGRPEPSAAARIGVASLWFATIGTLPALITAVGAAPSVAGWTVSLIGWLGSLPLLTIWLSRAWQAGWDPVLGGRRLLRRGSRSLIRSVQVGSHGRAFDLRGAALGLLAAGLALAVGTTPFVIPLQGWSLVALIHVRNEPFGTRVWAPSSPELRTWGRGAQRLVLLQMDPAIVREALTSRSESEVQAEVIRRLGRWGALRVVLPPPSLSPAKPFDFSFFGLYDFRIPIDVPPLTKADGDRSARALPALADAMRAAGNVVLLTPETLIADELKGPYSQIARAAREPGRNLGIDRFGLQQLPAIATDTHRPARGEEEPLPAPVVLIAAVRGVPPAVRPVPGHPDRVRIAGFEAPQIAPGRVLVNFMRPEPGRGFPRIPYSTVLRDEPQHASGEDVIRGRWLPPDRFFKGKIVFLDALDGREARRPETPNGLMSQNELLANATNTLLSGITIRRLGAVPGVLLALALGLLAGVACLRRDPLQASGIVAAVLVGTFLLSAYAILSHGLWIDVVVLTLAVLGSGLLVTRLTFALERDERERNHNLLRRFVAPQVVHELLDDPERKLGLGGRRERICVLFADARDSTGFAERHTPEQVIEVTNLYMTALTEALFAHGGLLDKYTGDGLMALFRQEGSVSVSAEQCALAALAMRDAAETVSLVLNRQGRDPLAFGFGMHEGEAVVGLVGSPIQFNYTALGMVVVVAERLQSRAAAGEIVVSESLYRQVADAFLAEPVDPAAAAGLPGDVKAYRLIGLRKRASHV